MINGGVMKDGLAPALNGANRLGDGVKTRAIQNISMYKGEKQMECNRAASDERRFARLIA